MIGSLLTDLKLKSTSTDRRTWVSDKEMIEYHEAVELECGCNQVREGVGLDCMSNEDYKKGVLECYRRALETVPMPSEKQEG